MYVCIIPGEGQKLKDTEEQSKAVILPLERRRTKQRQGQVIFMNVSV